MQWCMQAATDIGGASAGLQQVAVVAPEKVQSTVELFEQRFIRYFGYVDQQLQGYDFLGGDFSFADIMLYPNYVLRRALIERLADLPTFAPGPSASRSGPACSCWRREMNGAESPVRTLVACGGSISAADSLGCE